MRMFVDSGCRTRHPWELARLDAIRILLKQILNKQSLVGDTILDIGCGDGYVTCELSRQWPEMKFVGVDPALTTDDAEYISKHQDSGKQCRFFRTIEEVSEEYLPAQVALLLDVLEHVENDQELLCDVVSNVAERGYILIIVPAFQKLYCDHDKWLGHYRRYSKKQLSGVVRKSGLTLLKEGYFFSGLLCLRFFYNCAEKVGLLRKPSTFGVGKWSGGKYFASILSKTLSFNVYADMALQKLRVPQIGLSCFALCQKSI